MKFLDANGLALFTKKIFSRFVSSVSGADNKITITKGDGTKTEINLNEVIKTDIIAENPPENDDTLKIPSTSWTQEYCKKNYLKIDGTANKAIADKNNLVIDENYLKLIGGNLTGDLNTTANIVPQNNGEGSLGTSTKKWGTGYIETLHGIADKAVADKNGLQIDTNYLKLTGGNITGELKVSGLGVIGNLNTDNVGYLRYYKDNKQIFAINSNPNADGVFFSVPASGYTNPNYMIFRKLNTHSKQADLVVSFVNTPNAPTPASPDNSTNLATTAFVKAQSATMSINTLAKTDTINQYWTKEPSGTITQYMEVDLNDEQEIDVLFPISFPHKCLFVYAEIVNREKDTSINCSFHTIQKTTDSAKLLKVGTGNPKKIVVRAIGI